MVPDAAALLDEIDDVDVWVIFDNGERWSGTVCTLENVHRVMDDWREAGECPGGLADAPLGNLIIGYLMNGDLGSPGDVGHQI
ncbi:hypothetical protein [Streptomyces azureus]|uniref:Uncharacterized protein n=1 Tax=Streptomyces azureus TaxID=146537 RepID=A0A0K8PP47_STRAJ|nr:hypothetical protein [Streptomyces azureus]GAP49652.1 uncharacterized protein SAZU_4515 [Streptomyces azureus]